METIEENILRRVNVGDLLGRTASRMPAKIAVIDQDRSFTYSEFNGWANRIARGLIARGYERGDALALISSNSAEFLAICFACAKIGVVFVPINLLWGQGEIAHVMRHSRARGAVIEDRYLPVLLEAIADIPEIRDLFVIGEEAPSAAGRDMTAFAALYEGQDDAAPLRYVGNEDAISYLYTSGTTAAPKGVVNTQLSTYLEALGGALDMRFSQADRVAAMLPMFHTAQLYAQCTPAIAVGATILVLKGFEPRQFLDLIEREKLTVIFGLPMMYRGMMAEQEANPRDVSSLRLAIYAMAPMVEKEIRRAIDMFGCDLTLLFGQTEMNPIATLLKPEHQLTHSGAVGTPAINVEVAIMNEEGRLLPSGELGEIVYRSPQVLTGYLRNEDATREVFRHGWFHSGDAGHIDSDGVLWFADRVKDVIKTGGENVASLEIERVIIATETGIAETVVIGLPHDHWGEAITAFVVPQQGQQLDADAMKLRLRQSLSHFKCPKGIIQLESLPKTATGKIQKHILRREFADYYRSAEAS